MNDTYTKTYFLEAISRIEKLNVKIEKLNEKIKTDSYKSWSELKKSNLYKNIFNMTSDKLSILLIFLKKFHFRFKNWEINGFDVIFDSYNEDKYVTISSFRDLHTEKSVDICFFVNFENFNGVDSCDVVSKVITFDALVKVLVRNKKRDNVDNILLYAKDILENQLN
jgi:hypothetical protein